MVKIKDLVSKYGNREIDEVELEKILKPVKKTIYNLEVRDIYWFIDEFGKVVNSQWDNDTIDNQRLSVGNVFLTKEDAELEVEYLKIRAELKRYASMCETEVDWNNSCQDKYTIAYDHKEDCLDINTKYSYNHGSIFFTDKSILKQAIEEIGEERIVEYYLGVK